MHACKHPAKRSETAIRISERSSMAASADHLHWSPSAPDALLVFLVAAVAVVGLCGASAAASRKGRRTCNVDADNRNNSNSKQVLEEVVLQGVQGSFGCGHGVHRPPEKLLVFSWEALKKVMATSSASGGDRSNHKVADSHDQRSPEKLPAAAGAGATTAEGSGRTPVLPLWQRRILMGERCELPRFSGLILYDERGRLLHGGSSKDPAHLKVESAAKVTTLRDLL